MLTVNTIELDRPYRALTLIDGIGQAEDPVSSKKAALAAMTQKAQAARADAIVNVRYTHSSAVLFQWGIREFHTTIVSGTAIKFLYDYPYDATRDINPSGGVSATAQSRRSKSVG